MIYNPISSADTNFVIILKLFFEEGEYMFDRSKAVYFFCGSFYVLCLSCFRVCSLLPCVTCWERADSWLLFVMFVVILLLSPLVSYLIVSIPDPGVVFDCLAVILTLIFYVISGLIQAHSAKTNETL